MLDDLEKGGDGDALRTVKDLAAGAAGGIAQVLIGMCNCFARQYVDCTAMRGVDMVNR